MSAFLFTRARRIERKVRRAVNDQSTKGRAISPSQRMSCWYQVSTEDRTIDPELERFLARRMKATTIEIKSSHVSLVSHPKEIADLILLAAGHEKL
jgi:hypothetical protein